MYTEVKVVGDKAANQAIEAHHTITAESEFRERERLWVKARHDEAQALYSAERRAKLDIAKNALQMNIPISDIARLTGLSYEEIEQL
jgi:predicted transposase/invertase (TIGR01784 family)